MLKFDAETTRLLDQCYVGSDISRRRRASFDRLRPAPGDRILDIGCGNGLLSLELGRAVGPAGRVHGVDPSEEMRASAEDRCAHLPWVTFHDGAAGDLPVADSCVDKAVSVQVFEYIPDIAAALTEAHRVLRPDARLVIGDIHFATLAWHSDAPGRMARMIAAWEHHAAFSDLPAHLPGHLRAAGFAVDDVLPETVCDTDLRPDGLANMMIRLMVPYAVEGGHLAADEAEAWAAEQHRLAREGRFFFSLTHFVTVARKVGA